MKPNMYECDKCGQHICEHLEESNEHEIRPMLVLSQSNAKLPNMLEPNQFFSSIVHTGSTTNSPIVSRTFALGTGQTRLALNSPRIVRAPINQERVTSKARNGNGSASSNSNQ